MRKRKEKPLHETVRKPVAPPSQRQRLAVSYDRRKAKAELRAALD